MDHGYCRIRLWWKIWRKYFSCWSNRVRQNYLFTKTGKNNLLGELKEIFWLSKISLSAEREKIISVCFQQQVHFKYPRTDDDFNMELTFFQRKRHLDNNINVVIGENNIYNKLIVMDDVCDLTNKFNDFAKFLTISRKFYFTCVYDFHTIYPKRSNWQIILSQTKILIIFSGSFQTSSVVKILSSYCNRYTDKYILHRDLWLSRLYFEISNSPERKCLTIDMRHVNKFGPSKFRPDTENDKEQIYYHNCN